MIKKIKQTIKNFKRRNYAKKYNAVRNEWVEFFTTRYNHLKPVEFLPTILADEQMNYITAAGELDYYYKRVMNYRKGVA